MTRILWRRELLRVFRTLQALLCFGFTLGDRSLAEDPLYANSIVSTEFDFIRDHEPSVLASLEFVKFSRKEMPDSRGDELFAKAYVFMASFSDKTRVQVWAHEDFGSQARAKVYVDLLANAIGQQPNFNRVDLDHVVLHHGDSGAFAEEKGKFFVIYSKNIDKRIKHHDLQETVFHESAHVAFEGEHATAPGWLAAQKADSGFVTAYAKDHPLKEDIPESAIFAFTVLNRSERLPAAERARLRKQIPNRIAYLAQLKGFVTPRPVPKS